ncbi:hypothetical protein CFT12S02225_08360 [Campylobacter fetus subsp. testudinum]|uniref:Uncharacterized protein n=1 Tax=Campylobacter fetus subsp. testudinum TaxID=1507806 RepID=A0AAX0HA43_CAMFE|nr:hypothetical protein [Campylobacter fetus]OCR90117.1 hypothetical protein CFT12S02225_08360 [Campylobacter fetus subsp. testudinum]
MALKVYIYKNGYYEQNLHYILKWLSDIYNNIALLGYINKSSDIVDKTAFILYIDKKPNLKNINLKNAHLFTIKLLLSTLKKDNINNYKDEDLAFNKALQISLFFSEIFQPKKPKFKKLMFICDNALNKINSYYINKTGKKIFDVGILYHKRDYKSHTYGIAENINKLNLKIIYCISSIDGSCPDEYKSLNPKICLPWHILHHLSICKVFVTPSAGVFTRGKSKKFFISHAFLSGMNPECFKKLECTLSISSTIALEYLKKYGLDKYNVKLAKVGYPSLDYKLSQIKNVPQNPKNIFLSIDNNTLIYQSIEPFIKNLLDNNQTIIFRPKPQNINNNLNTNFISKFKKYTNFIIDNKDVVDMDELLGCFLLISDYGSMLFTFTFATNRPALIFDPKKYYLKSSNPFYNKNLHLTAYDLDTGLKAVQKAKDADTKKIKNYLKTVIYNLGKSSEAIAKEIEGLVIE